MALTPGLRKQIDESVVYVEKHIATGKFSKYQPPAFVQVCKRHGLPFKRKLCECLTFGINDEWSSLAGLIEHVKRWRRCAYEIYNPEPAEAAFIDAHMEAKRTKQPVWIVKDEYAVVDRPKDKPDYQIVSFKEGRPVDTSSSSALLSAALKRKSELLMIEE